MTAPFDASCPHDVPENEQPAWDTVVRSLGFLAEHYLRNRRPVESFALLSFLDEIGHADRRLKKMYLVAAVDIQKCDVAERLLRELTAVEAAVDEEEQRILRYYEWRVRGLLGEGS